MSAWLAQLKHTSGAPSGAPSFYLFRCFMTICKSIGCTNQAETNQDFCTACLNGNHTASESNVATRQGAYHSLGDMTEIDAFGVAFLFGIQDPSGCLQHASRKILSHGSKPGPGQIQAIREARDTLTRWLQLNT